MTTPEAGLKRVRLQLMDVSDELDDLQQVVQAQLLPRRDLDEGDVAAPFLRHDLDVGKLLLDTVGVRGFQVDLVDGDHHRHLGRLDVRHGLPRCRHHAVVGGHDQHGDVGRLRAPRPHGREGLVAGGVEERDLAALGVDLVGADVLGDAASLPFRHVGGADGVEQLGLAVVDVTHDGDDRRPRLGVGVELRLAAAGCEIDALAGEVRLLLVRLPAERTGHARRGGVVDLLVDSGHQAKLHQLLDDLDAGRLQLVAQLANGQHRGERNRLTHRNGRRAAQGDGARAAGAAPLPPLPPLLLPPGRRVLVPRVW